MEAVISYAKTVLFFLLFVNLVMQLLKGSAYERFVRPVCGMILVILILHPVLKMFGTDEKLLVQAEQKISLFLAQNNTDFTVPKESGYEFTVLEAYKKELTVQLEDILKKEGITLISADFSVSAEEKDFGTVRRISVKAVTGTDGYGGEIKIAPIVFERGGTNETASAKEIHIKDKLADFYNLEQDNIYVSIKEEKDG
ncbi:MAG: stage III sporulation protein AF [Lachnospiraceae bacterium]|nr:stage III sporulation protein AF [Lachnospiraceae bacterium]